MKPSLIITGVLLVCSSILTAEEATEQDKRNKHKDGASAVADEQDELSADAQQLVIEQTVPQVIELIEKAKKMMDESTDALAKAKTDGETIAVQTEIIEMILAAAKEKQNQGGGGKSGGAMMDMAERMAGKEPQEKPSQGKDGKPNDSGGGGGASGDSNTGNDADGGQASGKSETRKVPKAAGTESLEIPEEFRKAFDAYNRGAEKKIK